MDTADIQRGIPVATVGIANSTNAALLAIRILGTSIPEVLTQTEAYSKQLTDEVLVKCDKLEEQGWDVYAKDLAK